MPTEEQTEWPSFDGVLKDVLPEGVSERLRPDTSLAAKARRNVAEQGRSHAATSSTGNDERHDDGQSIRQVLSSVEKTLAKSPSSPRSALDQVEAELPLAELEAAPAEHTTLEFSLPEPLAPLDLDTSYVRTLLERSPEDTSFDTSALEALAPTPELTELDDLTDLDEPTQLEEPTEFDEPTSSNAEHSEDLDPITLEADIVAGNDDLLDKLSDLDDDAGRADRAAHIFADLDEASIFASEEAPAAEVAHEPVADIEEEPVAEIDEEPQDPETLEATHGIEFATADDEGPAVFAITDIDDYNFEELPTADPDRDFFTDADQTIGSTEISPLSAGDDAVVDAQGAEVVELFEGSSSFDSVATADAIESELFDLGAEDVGDDQPDNVVQLHEEDPFGFDVGAGAFEDSSANALEEFLAEEPDSAQPVDLAQTDEFALLTDVGTSWSDDVGSDEIEPSESTFLDDPDVIEEAIATQAKQKPSWRPVENRKKSDPWAEMRPTDEVIKPGGWWANRPKFFGGDERRKRRAERDAEREREIEREVSNAIHIDFDRTCPSCGAEGIVDLDDPVGRRVHMSCDSCHAEWHTPYLIESEAS